jgi:hypothetical protein
MLASKHHSNTYKAEKEYVRRGRSRGRRRAKGKFAVWKLM